MKRWMTYSEVHVHSRYFLFLGSGILGIFIILVWFRNYEWKNSLTLYKYTVKRSPRSAVARTSSEPGEM